ncbi:DUF192 domain-containing protein [Candidatus Gracilibacteria bacterium]|nr:DUF192 domain-containing protein [Candidatus Gracilibacteria bacterium]
MMMKNTLRHVLAVSLILLFAIAAWLNVSAMMLIKTATGTSMFLIERATTKTEQALGLMYRSHLPKGHGMLFLFDEPLSVSFWMKHTKIPLAMIFFDADGRVVQVVAEALPCADTIVNCPLYPSHQPVLAVLEINSGDLRDLSIQQGDQAYWLPSLQQWWSQ